MPAAAPIRVFLADDHPVYRDGIRRALTARAGIELVGEAADGRSALEEIQRLEPDVAVVDMGLPQLDGREVLAGVRAAELPTRVLFLSGQLEPEVVYRAMAGGAQGYLSKVAQVDEICAGVEAVARGEIAVSPELQSAIFSQLRDRESRERPALSDRELEVLRLTADGLSAPQIGERLELSAATIKSHLQSLYEKLGVSDRAAAVAVALRRGLVE